VEAVHREQDSDRRRAWRRIAPDVAVSTFREIARGREPEFLDRGYRPRHVFAHRLYQLPKCGPDGYKLAQAACGLRSLSAHWQVLLYADPVLAAEFPPEVFADDDVMWHRQQLGVPGQVASATVLLEGDVARSLVHQSDLVQRSGRLAAHRSRVENRFKGWPQMLLNGVLTFARERGARRLLTPTADLALEHTDPARDVGRELFERVYDRPVERFAPEQRDGWWAIDLERNAARLVTPSPASETLPVGPAVCVCHDVEGGHGHRDVDPVFARRADATSQASLEAMLEIEASAGISATYQVVGLMMAELEPRLRDAGHTVAFHSFDHSVPPTRDQLAECRGVDYRIKGYRPPRSLLTDDLRDERLAFHNFEWLASSAASLGTDVPTLPGRIAKIPVSVDDFALHTGELTYAQWEAEVLRAVEDGRFTSIGLHDCYAEHWLPHYPELLDRVTAFAQPRTFDDVAAGLFLAHAV
jgi:hypothetical protein